MVCGFFYFLFFSTSKSPILHSNISTFRYVPNPSPSVFRTTKNNHNILQGVAAPDLRLTQEAKDGFDAWILKNGLRWTAEGGPLAPGGVDVAFIGQCPLFLPCILDAYLLPLDDPQMPGLIPLIKKIRPDLPIVYRSHIEIRSDLVHVPGSPQEEVWNYLWNNIQLADLFISKSTSPLMIFKGFLRILRSPRQQIRS
jgi:hypothetical protein